MQYLGVGETYKAATKHGVILEILTHVGILNDNFNVVFLEQVLRANSTELKNLGALDSTRAYDNLSFGGGMEELALNFKGDAGGPWFVPTHVPFDSSDHAIRKDRKVIS